MGDTGETINAAAGLSLIVLGCTGIVLWPRRMRLRWKAYDLHTTIGIVAVAFLLMWSLTAAGQAFWPDPDEPIPNMRSKSVTKNVSFDRQIRKGDAALPGELTFVGYANGGVVVRKRVPGDPDPYGYSYVAIDDAGTVTKVYDTRTFPPLWRVRKAMYAVHIGSPGGPVLRAAYAVMGLAPAALFTTAFLMWLRKVKRSEQLPGRAPLS